MSKFINIGHGNMIAAARIVAVVSPESQPIKRLVQDAKEEGRAIDVTGGRKTRAVLVMENGSIVLSALLPETILNRHYGKDNKGEEDE